MSVYRIKRVNSENDNEKTKSFDISEVVGQKTDDISVKADTEQKKNEIDDIITMLKSENVSRPKDDFFEGQPSEAIEESEEDSKEKGEQAPVLDYDDSDVTVASPTTTIDIGAFVGDSETARHSAEKVADKLEDIYKNTLDIAAIKQNNMGEGKGALEDVFSREEAKPGTEKSTINKEALQNAYNDKEEPDDNDDDIDEIRKEKKERIEKEIPEYTSAEQTEEMLEIYRAKSIKQLIGAIGTLVVSILLLYLEMAPKAGLPPLAFLVPGKFGILYLLVDLQLLLISGAFILNNIYRGARKLFAFKPNCDSITFVVMACAALQILLHLIFNSSDPDIMLYSSFASFSALVNSVYNYIKVRREYLAFKVISSKKKKFCATALDKDSAEYNSFSEYLPEDPDMYRIVKSEFVDEFVNNTTKPSPFDSVYKISIPLVLIIGIVFAIISTALDDTASIGRAFDNFAMLVMMALPMSALFTVALPFFKASKKLALHDSALIGESAISEYAGTTVISFDDTEIFPAKAIKVTSIKNYGSGRIDSTIMYVAKIFRAVGGPLCDVFNKSVIELEGDNENPVKILEITENGICAKIDDKEIFVGNKNYMLSYDFGFFKDEIDDSFESTNGRIMYMAIDDEITSKFYIKYAVGRKFEALLRSLYKIGICVSIRSNDPNLSTRFLLKLFDNENYPISVIKTNAPSSESTVSNAKTGIVSASTIVNILRAFVTCDKLKQIISLNTLVKYISLLLGIFIVIISYFTGGANQNITPLFVLMYQALWMLPVAGISYFQ